MRFEARLEWCGEPQEEASSNEGTKTNPERLSVLKHLGPLTAGLRVVILSFWVPDVLWVRVEVQFQHLVLVPAQETQAASQLTKETQAASKLTKEAAEAASKLTKELTETASKLTKQSTEAASKLTKESTEASSKLTKETASRFQVHSYGILFELKQRHTIHLLAYYFFPSVHTFPCYL